MAPSRRLRASLALALCAAAAGACAPDRAGGGFDSGLGPIPTPRDAGPAPGADDDNDGLCNGTEARFGTDPQRADSDGDGLLDRIELELGFRPTRNDSPTQDRIVLLPDRRGAEALVPFPFVVRGDFDDYVGTYRDLALPQDDESADRYFRRFIALGASPPERVFAVEVEEARVRGVDGRVELAFQAEFEVPADGLPRPCARALPFQIQVKRAGATLVRAAYVLVVLPSNQTLRTAGWCPPLGCL